MFFLSNEFCFLQDVLQSCDFHSLITKGTKEFFCLLDLLTPLDSFIFPGMRLEQRKYAKAAWFCASMARNL